MADGRTIGLSMAVGLLASLLGPEFRKFLLDITVQPSLQLWAIAKHEEDFQPDEKWRQEDRLHEVVEQGWGSSLEDSVADELHEPGDDVHADGNVVGFHAVGRCEVVRVGSSTHEQRGEHGACYWLHQDVERGIDEARHGAEVEWQIWYREPVWGWQRWAVGSLKYVLEAVTMASTCLDVQRGSQSGVRSARK